MCAMWRAWLTHVSEPLILHVPIFQDHFVILQSEIILCDVRKCWYMYGFVKTTTTKTDVKLHSFCAVVNNKYRNIKLSAVVSNQYRIIQLSHHLGIWNIAQT